MAETKIEWADTVWNPVTGCTKVSEGCRHCYAEVIARRFWGKRKFTDVQCHDDRLDIPVHFQKPRKIFVNSMSDLFHPDVSDEFIDKVGITVTRCQGLHTWIILTKRPKRMKEYFMSRWIKSSDNIWLGVSVENQQAADERIPILLTVPGAVRFVSVEPMLSAIDLTACRHDGVIDIDSVNGIAKGIYNEYPFPSNDLKAWPLSWVICGGETGPGARPLNPAWVRSLRDQCVAANVPFFFKSWGEWSTELPQGLNMANREQTYQDGVTYYRVGKKLSGRLVDGVEWNQMPGELL